MTDLDPIPDPDLAFLVEPTAVPADGAAVARARGARLHRRRTLGAVAAGLCLVLALTALAVAARGGRGTASTADHRRTSVPHVDPPLPKGWRHVDWGNLRFAVPGDWSVRTGSACQGTEVVLQSGSVNPLPSCVKLPDDRQVVVSMPQPVTWRCRGTPTVNGLPTLVPCAAAQPGAAADQCTIRACTLQLASGEAITIRVADPEVNAEVVRSITTSPAYRAVHDGPTLDTRHWKTVTGAGVTMTVPPSWKIVRLGPEQDFGYCGPPAPRQAIVGGRFSPPSCPVAFGGAGAYQNYGNSAWAHRSDPLTNGIIGSRSLQHVTINGHRLTTVDTGAPGNASPTVTVLVGPLRHANLVDLSIGGDPDVTRTILTTIRPSR